MWKLNKSVYVYEYICISLHFCLCVYISIYMCVCVRKFCAGWNLLSQIKSAPVKHDVRQVSDNIEKIYGTFKNTCSVIKNNYGELLTTSREWLKRWHEHFRETNDSTQSCTAHSVDFGIGETLSPPAQINSRCHLKCEKS